jgi:hypothetical protein
VVVVETWSITLCDFQTILLLAPNYGFSRAIGIPDKRAFRDPQHYRGKTQCLLQQSDRRTSAAHERTAFRHERRRRVLPFRTSNVPGLPLTDNEFLTFVESDEPALAANHAHFSNLLNVYEGVPMNTAERTVLQSFFDGAQILSCDVPLFESNDPSSVAIVSIKLACATVEPELSNTRPVRIAVLLCAESPDIPTASANTARIQTFLFVFLMILLFVA